MIEVAGLTERYGERVPVDSLAFMVWPGAIIVIVAENLLKQRDT